MWTTSAPKSPSIVPAAGPGHERVQLDDAEPLAEVIDSLMERVLPLRAAPCRGVAAELCAGRAKCAGVSESSAA